LLKASNDRLKRGNYIKLSRDKKNGIRDKGTHMNLTEVKDLINLVFI